MSSHIALEDGRSWWAANWAYDAVVRSIVDALNRQGEKDLAAWLSEQTCLVQGPGLGRIDLRELAPKNRELFRAGARDAFRREMEMGAVGWNDPAFFKGWLDRFGVLLRLIDSVDRHDDPLSFNPHANGLMPVTREKKGPGWNE